MKLQELLQALPHNNIYSYLIEIDTINFHDQYIIDNNIEDIIELYNHQKVKLTEYDKKREAWFYIHVLSTFILNRKFINGKNLYTDDKDLGNKIDEILKTNKLSKENKYYKLLSMSKNGDVYAINVNDIVFLKGMCIADIDDHHGWRMSYLNWFSIEKPTYEPYKRGTRSLRGRTDSV